MTQYKSFKPPVLNPRNAGEIVDAAVSTAYRLSGGQLRNFLPGSPFMVLLEALVFAHMEFLHWCENLPDALVFSLFAKLLGVGISQGSYSEALVTVSITGALQTPFVIPRGATLVSNLDETNEWVTTDQLVIAPGFTSGSVPVRAKTLGSATAVPAATLTAFTVQYAFVSQVTNPQASTVGADPEDPYTAQLQIQALMSQRNPSSPEDWVVLAQSFFGANTVVRVVADTPNLNIYIRGLTPGPQLTAFEAEIERQRTLLQEVRVLPYESIGIDLDIRYTGSTPEAQECIDITTQLNSFVVEFNGNPQAVDLYEQFVQITGNNNLAGFDLKVYPLGILLWDKPLRPYDIRAGAIARDSAGNYYQGVTDTHVVASPFDEAELGLLNYHPILEDFSGGFVQAGYIVRNAGDYYLITQTGPFDPGSAQLLAAPTSWGYDLGPLAQGDFIRLPSTINEFSHGFIAAGAYTTASDWQPQYTPITPLSLGLGDVVNPGDVWALNSRPAVLYIADAPATLTAAYVQAQTPAEIYSYPAPQHIDHWLKSHGRYRIGVLTADENFVIVAQDGTKLPIPPGINTETLVKSSMEYGSLFYEDGEIYEFQAGALATDLDTWETLGARRATRVLDDFDFVLYPSVPYFLRLASVAFLRGQANDPEKLVMETPGGFEVV
jgi:hypothetical protein